MYVNIHLEALLLKLNESCIAAQHELYKRYYGTFMSICMRYAASHHDAEEILQDSFLKIFTNIGQFKNEGSFEGWMKRIVVHTALDYTRSKQAKRQLSIVHAKEPTFSNTEPMDAYTIPDYNLVEAKWDQEALLQILSKLTKNQATVFNLFVMEGFSHKEIAHMLYISERGSQLFLQQARQKLTVLLQPKNEIQSQAKAL
jgi:RNA polymerase sigma factor (sigma-70 family)